ncbi:hypothetical protein [Salipiger thiooxidans]|uniref:hypothetical protein n=1 Tax=Salipiger thiooxidans TaxID=282683 RepID=UPI001CD342B8|nr:hypothetical protein [Salipiger thiooxidans]MCA0846134.1 hypothetical protein [Salipiger thiooxidans]
MIGPDEWQHQRFGWLESVRRDPDLSAQAQVLAHVFVLDFANKHTVQGARYPQVRLPLENRWLSNGESLPWERFTRN